jgi:hypothetical protein
MNKTVSSRIAAQGYFIFSYENAGVLFCEERKFCDQNVQGTDFSWFLKLRHFTDAFINFRL